MSKINRIIVCFCAWAAYVRAQELPSAQQPKEDLHGAAIVNTKLDNTTTSVDLNNENEAPELTNGDPCYEAGELFDGNSDLETLPVDYLSYAEARYMEQLCWGYPCEWTPCFPSFPFQWGKYTATCTEVVSLTTYSSKGDVGTLTLVFPACDCPLELEEAFPACVIDRGTTFFPAIEGKCYTFAIFSGDTLIIEPMKDLTYICDYFPLGDYIGDRRHPYDNVAALVSCQSDCTSPSCIKCFDLEADGQIDLRDFAEFQNNFPWF
jgi:hypothetical protein